MIPMRSLLWLGMVRLLQRGTAKTETMGEVRKYKITQNLTP
jgi:hypothetical protein